MHNYSEKVKNMIKKRRKIMKKFKPKAVYYESKAKEYELGKKIARSI